MSTVLLVLGGHIAGGLLGTVFGFWFWSKRTDRVLELVFDEIIDSGGFRHRGYPYVVKPGFKSVKRRS